MLPATHDPITCYPYLLPDQPVTIQRVLMPEERLVVLIAHRVVDRDVLAEAVGQVGQWERVVGLGARHGLLPLMAAHLRGLAVPQSVARTLAIGQIQTRHRNEATIAEMLRFTAAIETRDVRYAVYKGPVAALRYYGDVALRDYSDFDVLVDRESMPVVDEVIRDLDYSLLLYEDAHAHARNRRKGCEEAWTSATGAVLDLHWTLTDDFFPIRLTTAELLSRCVAQPVPGGAVRAFSEEDDLIVLATHAAKHLFHQLESLTTLGELMTQPGLDWDAVLERAARGACATSVVLACTLASRVLGYRLPEAIGSLRVRPRDVDELAGAFERELFAVEPSAGAMTGWRAALRLFDRRLDGVRSAFLMVFAPRPADAQAIPLPPRLRWLHYVARPFRLVGKYARRLVTSIGR